MGPTGASNSYAPSWNDPCFGTGTQEQPRLPTLAEFPAFTVGQYRYPQDAFAYGHDGPLEGHDGLTSTPLSAGDGSYTASGGRQRQADTPSSNTQSRVSKSPAPPRRGKKNKKSKMDKSKVPIVPQPLSILTKDMPQPLANVEKWVNRSIEQRRDEVSDLKTVPRPMNSFMLYRSYFTERTKAWCGDNNHQTISTISGNSWKREPEEVRDRFKEWATIDRNMHHLAHPNYKFQPAKTTAAKRRRAKKSDDDQSSELDAQSGSEYRASGRNKRQRRESPSMSEEQTSTPVGFATQPYYDAFATTLAPYSFAPTQTMQAQSPFTPVDTPFTPIQGAAFNQPVHAKLGYYPVQQSGQNSRTNTPASQSMGQFGMPAPSEGFFDSSRGSTPMQPMVSYGQPIYHQQPVSAGFAVQPGSTQYRSLPPVSQVDQFSLNTSQSHHGSGQVAPAIDPSLDFEPFAEPFTVGSDESHFDEALAGLTSEQIADLPLFFTESESAEPIPSAQWTLPEDWNLS